MTIMKTVSVTYFKAHCLRLIDQVSKTGEIVRITKRGKVLAQLNASSTGTGWTPPGLCAGTVVSVGDVTSPVSPENQWDVEKPWF
jgi:antitoxin (DNA-binding transcriptional repressor) of toxin-antitoxin stability system